MLLQESSRIVFRERAYSPIDNSRVQSLVTSSSYLHISSWNVSLPDPSLFAEVNLKLSDCSGARGGGGGGGGGASCTRAECLGGHSFGGEDNPHNYRPARPVTVNLGLDLAIYCGMMIATLAAARYPMIRLVDDHWETVRPFLHVRDPDTSYMGGAGSPHRKTLGTELPSSHFRSVLQFSTWPKGAGTR